MKPSDLRVRPRNRGFTLIELMVVVTVLAVMTALAAPSFKDSRRNAGLTTVTNTLVSSVYRTRSEAMKAGVPVIMAPGNANGPSGTDWTQGWVIYTDANLDGAYNSTCTANTKCDEVLAVHAGDEIPSDYLAISVNGGGTVKFKGNGFPQATSDDGGNLTITVNRTDRPGDDRYVRRVKISKSGRVSTCRPDVDGDRACPAGASSS